jgi:hypothetical protein
MAVVWTLERAAITFTDRRAHMAGENGEWEETKHNNKNQAAFSSVLGPPYNTGSDIYIFVSSRAEIICIVPILFTCLRAKM